MSKKLGLGQGVGLLFGETQEKFFECDIEKILPNHQQPREFFDEIELENLAQSIREKGIIQPLIVKQAADKLSYQLIAGERRLRASKLAGLTRVPVIVTEVPDDTSMLELALIENIQRTDLNPLEEAEGYRKLIDEFGYTQEETAKRVGKQRSTVANLLRLLKLPSFIQRDLFDGVISEGHARVLIRLIDDHDKLHKVRDAIVNGNLSVRQTEQLVKKQQAPSKTRISTKQIEEISQSYCNALVTQLTNYLNCKVSLNHSGGRGKIEIDFYSPDDLDRLFHLLIAK